MSKQFDPNKVDFSNITPTEQNLSPMVELPPVTPSPVAPQQFSPENVDFSNIVQLPDLPNVPTMQAPAELPQIFPTELPQAWSPSQQSFLEQPPIFDLSKVDFSNITPVQEDNSAQPFLDNLNDMNKRESWIITDTITQIGNDIQKFPIISGVWNVLSWIAPILWEWISYAQKYLTDYRQEDTPQWLLENRVRLEDQLRTETSKQDEYLKVLQLPIEQIGKNKYEITVKQLQESREKTNNIKWALNSKEYKWTDQSFKFYNDMISSKSKIENDFKTSVLSWIGELEPAALWSISNFIDYQINEQSPTIQTIALKIASEKAQWVNTEDKEKRLYDIQNEYFNGYSSIVDIVKEIQSKWTKAWFPTSFELEKEIKNRMWIKKSDRVSMFWMSAQLSEKEQEVDQFMQEWWFMHSINAYANRNTDIPDYLKWILSPKDILRLKSQEIRWDILNDRMKRDWVSTSWALWVVDVATQVLMQPILWIVQSMLPQQVELDAPKLYSFNSNNTKMWVKDWWRQNILDILDWNETITQTYLTWKIAWAFIPEAGALASTSVMWSIWRWSVRLLWAALEWWLQNQIANSTDPSIADTTQKRFDMIWIITEVIAPWLSSLVDTKNTLIWAKALMRLEEWLWTAEQIALRKSTLWVWADEALAALKDDIKNWVVTKPQTITHIRQDEVWEYIKLINMYQETSDATMKKMVDWVANWTITKAQFDLYNTSQKSALVKASFAAKTAETFSDALTWWKRLVEAVDQLQDGMSNAEAVRFAQAIGLAKDKTIGYNTLKDFLSGQTDEIKNAISWQFIWVAKASDLLSYQLVAGNDWRFIPKAFNPNEPVNETMISDIVQKYKDWWINTKIADTENWSYKYWDDRWDWTYMLNDNWAKQLWIIVNKDSSYIKNVSTDSKSFIDNAKSLLDEKTITKLESNNTFDKLYRKISTLISC